MKQKVSLSLFSITLSGIMMIILLCALYYSNSSVSISIISAIIIVWCGLALYYMPLSVTVNDVDLCVNRTLCAKRIPLKEIGEIKRITASMLGWRFFGCDGCFGYWGWFKGKTLGKYFAYYGKESDCFFVRLKDGRQYVLGCDNPDAIVNYIKSNFFLETA